MTQALINLNESKPTFQFVPPLWLIYGRNGIGKSYFASKSNAPIFIDLDENIFELPVDSNRSFDISIFTFQDVISFLDMLYHQNHTYKTLVVDSLSSLEKLIIQKILLETGAKSLGDFQYGQGYLRMLPFWEHFLANLKLLRTVKKMTIILLGHYKEKRDPNLTGESYLQYQIDLYERAAKLLVNCCSAVFFADDKVVVHHERQAFGQEIAKAVASERVLYTDGLEHCLWLCQIPLPKSQGHIQRKTKCSQPRSSCSGATHTTRRSPLR
jgi:AAA domain